MGIFFIGLASSGFFVCILRALALTVFADNENQIYIFFGVSSLYLLLVALIQFWFSRTEYFKYHV